MLNQFICNENVIKKDIKNKTIINKQSGTCI